MAESNEKQNAGARRFRHKGRGSQVLIYLGKQLRFFINESDWKVLPMAAIIAALVGVVIRNRLFLNMEGSLMGGFALACVAIWNGCFNSIQAVCRERAIIKREHRAGMHISSYVAAHMIYQLGLCVAQTVLTMYVLKLIGVKFSAQPGFMTPWMIVDIGISMLLITYASDMMSLFISSISHTTTGAMTVMPFVLIFQLVFSGGIIPLPKAIEGLSDLTISSYGIRAVVSQTGYNEQPMVTGWKTVNGMRDSEFSGTVTLGQLLDLLDTPTVESRRDKVVVQSHTVGEAMEILESVEDALDLRDRTVVQSVTVGSVLEQLRTDEAYADLRSRQLSPETDDAPAVTVGSVLDLLATSEGSEALLEEEIGSTVTLGQVLDFLRLREEAEARSDEVLNEPVTLGQIADFLKNSQVVQSQRDRSFSFEFTVQELLDLFGEERVENLVKWKTAEAASNAVYDRTVGNIVENWAMLAAFALGFALLSVLALEFIDKDKR